MAALCLGHTKVHLSWLAPSQPQVVATLEKGREGEREGGGVERLEKIWLP